MNKTDTEARLEKTADSKKKKKILIFMCEGGGGHKTAADALHEILGEHYEVESVNVLTEIFSCVDSISHLTRGHFKGEDLYNFLLQRGLNRTLVLMTHAGIRYITAKSKLLQQAFEEHFSQKKNESVALVVSTVPKFNAALFRATGASNLPFLLLPTDLDTDTFLIGMQEINCREDEKFMFALPYDDPDLYLKAVLESNMKSKHLAITGFPIRPACQKKYTAHELEKFKEKHGLDRLRKTITLVMGAVGGNVIFKYVQELSKASFPFSVQINVCVGKNRKMGQKMVRWFLKNGGEIVQQTEGYTSIRTARGHLMHIRNFTKEIIEIMAASDLIITKTGSCSVNEAIYLGKKMLLDNTKYSSARHIWWEGFNVAFVKKHGLGDAVSHLRELEGKILALLQKSQDEHPTVTGDFRLPNFEENILTLIQRMTTAQTPSHP